MDLIQFHIQRAQIEEYQQSDSTTFSWCTLDMRFARVSMSARLTFLCPLHTHPAKCNF